MEALPLNECVESEYPATYAIVNEAPQDVLSNKEPSFTASGAFSEGEAEARGEEDGV